MLQALAERVWCGAETEVSLVGLTLLFQLDP